MINMSCKTIVKRIATYYFHSVGISELPKVLLLQQYILYSDDWNDNKIATTNFLIP